MKNKTLISAALDGVVQFLAIEYIVLFTTSKFSYNFSLYDALFIVGIFTLILASGYFILIKKLSNKTVVYFTILSICCFCLCEGLFFVVRITCSVNVFSARELNNADGIVILFTIIAFVALTLIFRLIVFSIIIVRNIISKTHNTGDGSKPLKKSSKSGT